MGYKDKEMERKAAAERARRYRALRKKGENVTPSVTPKIPEEAKKYPAVIEALVDPVKRAKMQAVCASLDHEIHTFEGRKLNLLGEVRYGLQGPTLTVCAQWLKATETVPQT